MQIVATIRRLLYSYTTPELLGHIAYEKEQQALHFLTVGAPIRADFLNRQAAVLRKAIAELQALTYDPRVPVPKS